MKQRKRIGFDPELLQSLCSHVRIPGKEGGEVDEEGSEGVLVPFDPMLPTQSYLLSQIAKGKAQGRNTFYVLKCLGPETRVLSSELKWVALGDIEIGQSLVGFDEYAEPVKGAKRALRESVVLDKWTSTQHAWKIHFADGTELTASGRHRFLVRQRGSIHQQKWAPLMMLKAGDMVRKIVSPWGDGTFEDGWAGGFIDGEGSLHCREEQGVRLSVYQRSNEALDRYRAYLVERGITFYESVDKRKGSEGTGKIGDSEIIMVGVGNIAGMLRVVGLSRPSRFIGQSWWAGKPLPRGGYNEIVKIEPIEATELIDIETTTGTFIAEGLATHNCRQSGVTTLGLGVALLWAFQHSGMIFCFIADNSSRLVLNRRLCQQFITSLKKVPAWRQEVEENNRYFVSFSNGSAIYWLNAGSDDEGGLGRSIGATASWGTELGCWKDEEGTLSLMSSISENNPLGLHVFEGTAKGPNLFKELYENAASEGNTSQLAIFVGWWLHPWYEHNLSDPRHLKRFETYWGACPRLSRDEARWVEGVKLRYGFDIRPTQISWWRWHLRERKKNNLLLMYQEYPPLEEDAWTYGGNCFIDGRKLSILQSRAIAAPKEPYRYFVFDPGDGVRFENSDMIEVDPLRSYYDLVCFADPIMGPRVRYCIGCDPAHGATEEGDHAAIEVFLCYSDKAVQVAEWIKREVPTYQIAWVILHLVGVYNSGESETHLNVEMQGGGTEVYQEIKRLQAEMAYGYTPKLSRYFQKISHYLYVRGDSTHGAGSTVHWETSWKTKPRMMHNLRNLLEREMLELKSVELIKECATVQQLRDGSIETGRENHRLMATAIGAMAYIQLLDIDIGGQEEFLSTNLKEVHDQKSDPTRLNPDQFMKILSDNWRKNLLARELDELEGVNESDAPEWLWMEESDTDYYEG